ncbi:DUF3737 family protein [Enterococcus casseliflavus]|uniref:DUF3737 family protein n=1 Tax=Enterococcus TaxID=1350 RepID=UPI003D0DB149
MWRARLLEPHQYSRNEIIKPCYIYLISSVVTSDGDKNIIIKNSKLLSKDAFWNCEDVTVYDSTIIAEYLGWNSKNLRFVNCYIEREQGMCHIEYLVIDGAKIINTDLVFEYSTVDINVTSAISNVKNTYSGSISASEIKELILEQPNKKKLKLLVKSLVLMFVFQQSMKWNF